MTKAVHNICEVVCLAVIKNVKTAREWVMAAQKLPIVSFRPTAVSKDTGLPLEKAFRDLMELVKEGALDLQYEISCPNCLRSIKKVEKPETCVAECIYCGEEMEFTPDVMFPIFILKKQ